MIPINTNGTYKIDFFRRPLSSVTTDMQFQLTGVKINRLYDKENQKYTDSIQDITYNIFIQELMSQISVKCNSSTPVITPEQLDAAMESGNDIYVELPVNDVYIKPYKIDKGMVYASISTPFVKLVKD